MLMKVLVTGGAGFIGSQVVDKLITLGHDVIILDNLSTGKKKNINTKAKFFLVDIKADEIKEIFSAEKPEIIIHQAASVDKLQSLQNPTLEAQVNIIGTINLLDNCINHHVEKIIYASSAAVYGDARYLPVDERHPTIPISQLGISKLTPEFYIRVYNQIYGLKFSILRYANVYGPRQNYKKDNGVVSAFIRNVLKGVRPCIYGDGQQKRDFVFISDVVNANILALTRGDDETFNISSGTGTEIKELVYILNCLTDNNLKPICKTPRHVDILHSYLDNSKARLLLDWVPTCSLKDGLIHTLDYFKKEILKGKIH